MNLDMPAFVQELLTSEDPEATVWSHLEALLDERKRLFADGQGQPRWQPGRPLRLLLAGYAGAGNVGSDIRVVEIIRQLHAIFGREAVDLGLVVVNAALPQDAFSGVRRLELTYAPSFAFAECAAHDGVVACEGSMFKSNFSDVLSILMAGGLALSLIEDKLAVGYGAEAGQMSERLRDLVVQHCRGAWIASRSEPSRQALEALGLRTAEGTDTAWTFEPAPPERAAGLLRAAGWDGRLPVLGICPINPFWWPVRIDLEKARALEERGEHRELHYGSVLFHHSSEEAERRYRAYLQALAGAVTAYRRERPVFPVLLGMERLDRRACEHLAELLAPDGRPPLFVSGDYGPHEIVSLLRACSLLLSSRYHAVVASMPALVPSAGVSMDERLTNLLAGRGHPHLLASTEEPELAEKLLTMLRRLERDREAIAGDIRRVVVDQVERMGQMGMSFADEVRRVYPDIGLPERPRNWEAYLPPLPAAVLQLLESSH